MFDCAPRWLSTLPALWIGLGVAALPSSPAVAAVEVPDTLSALTAALERLRTDSAAETAILERTDRQIEQATALTLEKSELLTQASVVLQEARDRRAVAARPDYDHTDDTEGYLDALDLVVGARRDAVGPRAAELQAAMLEHLRLQRAREASLQRLAELSAQRLQLRVAGEKHLQPPYLREVTLSVPDLRDQSPVILYRAGWVPGNAIAQFDRRISALAAAAVEIERMLPLLQAQIGRAEETLLEAEREWRRLEVDDPTLAWVEAVVAALIRPGDRAIPWVGADPLLGILIYRGGRPVLDGVLGEDRPDEPGLSEQLISLRSELSGVAVSEALAEVEPRPVSLIEIARAVEGLSAPTSAARLQSMRTAAARAAGAFRTAADHAADASEAPAALWRALFAGWLASAAGRSDDAVAAIIRDQLRSPAPQLDRLRSAMSGGAPDAGIEIIDGFRDQVSWQDAARDAVAGAVVLLEGSVVTDALSSERGQSIYEMALKEIEWFVRRNELIAATDLLHLHQTLLEALETALEQSLDERRAGCCERRFVPSLGDGDDAIVMADWQWSQVPELALQFGTKLRSFAYRFNETEAWRTLKPAGATVLVPLVREVEFGNAAIGRFTLEVQAASQSGNELDSRPEDAAALSRDLEWIDYQPGPDAHHGFTLARPALTVLDHDPSDLPGGAVFEVGYLAPRPHRGSGWIGIFPAGAPPDAAITEALAREYISGPVDAGHRDGRVKFAAPAEPGRYELRMYDRIEAGLVIASAPIAVRQGVAGPRSVHLIASVPEQTEDAEAVAGDTALRVGTRADEVMLRRVGEPFEGTLTVEPEERVFLAGDAGGLQPWGIDNFLLIEVTDGDEVRRLVVGKVDAVFHGDQQLLQLGSNTLTFGPNDIDLTPHLPRGTPFNLKVSALNYGGPGWVSDVYLVLRPR